MPENITLNVNGQTYQLAVDPDTPLQYVLRNDLGLKSPKIGCGKSPLRRTRSWRL
jgi:nicotinate dehydrogenase subunit A